MDQQEAVHKSREEDGPSRLTDANAERPDLQVSEVRESLTGVVSKEERLLHIVNHRCAGIGQGPLRPSMLWLPGGGRRASEVEGGGH